MLPKQQAANSLLASKRIFIQLILTGSDWGRETERVLRWMKEEDCQAV